MERTVASQIEFEIVKELGVLSTAPSGWRKEINIVSFNRHAPQFDIRDWSPKKDRMGRGISFNESEARVVLAALMKELG